MNNPWPLKAGTTTAGSRTIPALTEGPQALLQASLCPDSVSRAWAVMLASDGVIAGTFTIRAGDEYGSVDFVVPFALGRRFAELTVPAKFLFVSFQPSGPHPRDYAVGASVGLFAQN